MWSATYLSLLLPAIVSVAQGAILKTKPRDGHSNFADARPTGSGALNDTAELDGRGLEERAIGGVCTQQASQAF